MSMLIYHCRNYHNIMNECFPFGDLTYKYKKGIPYATIVVIKGLILYKYQIGVAICNPKDRFNKKMGVKIALGRAQKTTFEIERPMIPNYQVVNCKGKVVNMIDDLLSHLKRMEMRAQRYFK